MFGIRDILVRIWLRILLFSSVTFKKKTKSFYAYSFLKVHLHHSSKIKSHKEVTKQYTSRFSSFFCLFMAGTGSGTLMETRVDTCVVSFLHSQKELMLQAPKNIYKHRNKGSRSVTLWYGSGSGSCSFRQ